MLRNVVDPKHPLVILANSINWEVIEKNISPLFWANNGRPALAVRMVTGLLYLKNAYNLGDKALLETWLKIHTGSISQEGYFLNTSCLLIHQI